MHAYVQTCMHACVQVHEYVTMFVFCRETPAIASSEPVGTAVYSREQCRRSIIEPSELVGKMARKKTVEGNYIRRGTPMLVLKALIENSRPIMSHQGGCAYERAYTRGHFSTQHFGGV